MLVRYVLEAAFMIAGIKYLFKHAGITNCLLRQSNKMPCATAPPMPLGRANGEEAFNRASPNGSGARREAFVFEKSARVFCKWPPPSPQLSSVPRQRELLAGVDAAIILRTPCTSLDFPISIIQKNQFPSISDLHCFPA